MALKLRGGSSAWWDQLKINRHRFDKPLIQSWLTAIEDIKHDERFITTTK